MIGALTIMPIAERAYDPHRMRGGSNPNSLRATWIGQHVATSHSSFSRRFRIFPLPARHFILQSFRHHCKLQQAFVPYTNCGLSMGTTSTPNLNLHFSLSSILQAQAEVRCPRRFGESHRMNRGPHPRPCLAFYPGSSRPSMSISARERTFAVKLIVGHTSTVAFGSKLGMQESSTHIRPLCNLPLRPVFSPIPFPVPIFAATESDRRGTNK